MTSSTILNYFNEHNGLLIKIATTVAQPANIKPEINFLKISSITCPNLIMFFNVAQTWNLKYTIQSIQQQGGEMFVFTQDGITLYHLLRFMFAENMQDFHARDFRNFSSTSSQTCVNTIGTRKITDISKFTLDILPSKLNNGLFTFKLKNCSQTKNNTFRPPTPIASKETEVASVTSATAAIAPSIPRLVEVNDLETKSLNEYPFKEWTNQLLTSYFSSDNRLLNSEPTLASIKSFQRYGKKRRFKFLCNFQYQDTKRVFAYWINYSDLVLNSEYEKILIDNYEWNMDKMEHHYHSDLEEDDGSDFEYGDPDPDISQTQQNYVKSKIARDLIHPISHAKRDHSSIASVIKMKLSKPSAASLLATTAPATFVPLPPRPVVAPLPVVASLPLVASVASLPLVASTFEAKPSSSSSQAMDITKH